MPSYRIEEKVAGSEEWRRVEHPAAIRATVFYYEASSSRTIYSTMRAASLDCREIHDKNPYDDHRVVEIGSFRNIRDAVTYIIPAMGIDLDLDNRARNLRRDLTGTLVSDNWESPSERDLHIRAVLNQLERL